jgi:hypothetical protein
MGLVACLSSNLASVVAFAAPSVSPDDCNWPATRRKSIAALSMWGTRSSPFGLLVRGFEALFSFALRWSSLAFPSSASACAIEFAAPSVSPDDCKVAATPRNSHAAFNEWSRVLSRDDN